MEVKCRRNSSKNCWNRLIGIDYLETQACVYEIECPEPQIPIPDISDI